MSKDIANTVRKNLILIRESKGWTKKDFGERMSPPKSESAISRYESGARKISIETLGVMADILGVDPEFLFKK